MDYYNVKDHNLILDGEKEYILKFKDMADQEKPREKILKYGPDALSVAELVALVLNVGTKKEDVLAMANRILKEYGDKTIINEKSPKRLSEALDIPLVKATQVVAAFEIGRRYFEKKDGKSVFIRTSKHAHNYFKDMSSLGKEHLRGLYLNSRYQVVHDELISVGSLTANIIHPREIFRPAFEYNAVAIIIAHNHPSGSLQPTRSDIEVTNKLIEAGRILGIDLLDHIIIGKNKYISIMEKGRKND